VLLIDDDGDDRELFCEALKNIPFHTHCDTAPDGRRAISLLEKKEIELPGIIFLDINMPVMDGWHCLTHLKRSGVLKDIPVIMYSTSTNPEDVEKALQLGAQSFFSKPIDYKHLKAGLQLVLTHFTSGTLAGLPAHIS
jgi:CheY-like chemotaxis protein